MEKSSSVLCIPIKVQAMMVGKSPAKKIFANIADDYSRFSINPLGDYVPSGIMNDKSTEKSGVHLHWMLPDSLRQGWQKNDESAPEYLKVPNRWVVTRILSRNEEPTKLEFKHWMVESDALDFESKPELGNVGSLTYPKLDDPSFPYRILGRSYPYDAIMPEPEERLDNLTALGPGNPEFSVIYPFSHNVFGFYDDLLDAAGVRYENIGISYVVRGYYEDELDIIQSAEMCMEQLGWAAPKVMQYPATIALHGVITGLDWIDDRKDYNSEIIDNLKQPELAVGNTSAEAAAALQAVHDPANEHTMRLLLHDHSHKLLSLNGIYQTDYSDHERRFGVQAEKRAYKLQSTINDSSYSDLPVLTPEEQIVFRNLQAGIGELYSLHFAIHAKRLLIYDLWCKYMTKALVTDIIEKKEAEKLMLIYEEQIEQELEVLQQLEQEADEKHDRIVQLENQFIHHASFELQQAENGRYYVPNPPVLLMAGAQRGSLFQAKNREKLLKCRLLHQCITALKFQFSLRGQQYEAIIHANEVVSNADAVGNYGKLFQEAALFAENSAPTIAQLIGEQLQLLPFSEDERKSLIESIQQVQRSVNAGMVLLGQSFPDRSFLQVWKGPWNPVILCWRGIYYPDLELVGSKPTLSRWSFQDNDYRYIGTMDTQNAVAMEGKILLSPHIAEQLKALSLKQLGKDDMLAELDNLDYLSQALDGFNDRLLMSQLTLRFPIMVLKKGSAQLADRVRAALASTEYEKPLFNTFFSPLRGGFFKFDELRLIDTFGQFQQITVSEYAVAENMRREQQQIRDRYIMLPPRFVQPTRLDFNWLQARSKEICDFNLPDSPICGWLIPNHADSSLLVYDEAGNMLGSLVVTAFERNAVQWRNAPGITINNGGMLFAEHSHPLPTTMNPEMKAFLSEILRRSQEQQEDVLTPLLQIIDSALWDIHGAFTSNATGLSLYVGKPLVLAKASIKLEQCGPPAAYKSIDKTTKKPQPIPDISLKQFQMPLWVGEKHHSGDGVIGFFQLDGDSEYRQFNSAFVKKDRQSDYLKCNNEITISADEHAEAKTLSLILDPMASIHLISGMLPVYEQRIPPDRIETALANLFLTLYAGPMLVGEENVVMPLTNLPERKWSFITPQDIENWIETDKLSPSNENAFLAKPPYRAVEGWLKLNIQEVPKKNE